MGRARGRDVGGRGRRRGVGPRGRRHKAERVWRRGRGGGGRRDRLELLAAVLDHDERGVGAEEGGGVLEDAPCAPGLDRSDGL